MIEGDGYILIRKEKIGEKITPAIIITLHEKEEAMFDKLKTIFKPANIYKKEHQFAYSK